MNKQELRAYIKQQFHQSTATDRKQWSENICNQILADEKIKNAQNIMAFYPLSDEVNIKPLLDKFHQEGKNVLLPVVISETELCLRRYNDKESMLSGVLGTHFPAGEEYTDYDSIDAVLVPGLAFDKKGHRLGRGKGYYDRFLKKLSKAYTRAVCFPYQIVDDVPIGPHDITIHYV